MKLILASILFIASTAHAADKYQRPYTDAEVKQLIQRWNKERNIEKLEHERELLKLHDQLRELKRKWDVQSLRKDCA